MNLRNLVWQIVNPSNVQLIDSRDGVKRTSEEKNLFDGAYLFQLKASQGLPLDMAIDTIMNVWKFRITWVDFIEAARINKWWDFQTFEAIKHGLEDAGIPKDIRFAILERVMLYILDNPRIKEILE